MNIPAANTFFPLPHYDKLCFLKNIITRPNMEVGDCTYYDDLENVHNFEKNVKYHFNFTGDKLIIGKFCMIAANSIIVNEVAPYTIAGGNPAMVELEYGKITVHVQKLTGNDVAELVQLVG